MFRHLAIVALLGLVPAAGCAMCASPFDYCGPTYGAGDGDGSCGGTYGAEGCGEGHNGASCDFLARQGSILGGAPDIAEGEEVLTDPANEPQRAKPDASEPDDSGSEAPPKPVSKSAPDPYVQDDGPTSLRRTALPTVSVAVDEGSTVLAE